VVTVVVVVAVAGVTRPGVRRLPKKGNNWQLRVMRWPGDSQPDLQATCGDSDNDKNSTLKV